MIFELVLVTTFINLYEDLLLYQWIDDLLWQKWGPPEEQSE